MKKSVIKEFISCVLIIVMGISIALVLTKFAGSLIIVSGASMNDTLRDNDCALTFYYDLDDIDRFDIVVIDSDNDKRIIKRVIGLPFEEIEYIDNKLYVNGVYINEEFLSESTITNDFKVTLKEDEYYCLGDNRGISNDSRYYGAFSKSSILSSHIFRFFPFNRIGFIK